MKRTKKSQKKTKFLLILIVLTAILSITATYAWFSTQKDVEISTLRLNIEVAESLEISLNGKEWTNKITIDDMRQLYGTAATGKHQAVAADNANYIPTELLPVSTIGETTADGRLQFMTASAISGTTLKAIPCDESDIVVGKTIATTETSNKNHPYLAFDVYLKNISAVSAGDPLRLMTGSRVWADTGYEDAKAGTSTANTGAENAMRVGFVQYMNTLPATTATEDGSQIRALTATTIDDNDTPDNTDDDTVVASPKVAIWEPNDKEHIQEVVNNNSRVTSTSVNVTTYGIKFKNKITVDIDGTPTEKDVSADYPVEVNTTLAEDGDLIKTQNTIKPQYSTEEGKVGTTSTTIPLTTQGTDTAATSATGDIILPQNTISKFRIYVWLEGQDVDCINTASMAGKLDVTLKLDKQGKGSGTTVTYSDAATPTP